MLIQFCPVNICPTLRFVSPAVVFIVCLLPIVFSSVLKEELSYIQSKALEGDPHYQGTLGLFYKYGEKSLPIDLGEAERWAKLAAEKDGGVGLAVLASIELERGKTERGRFLYDEAYLHSKLRELAKTKIQLPNFVLDLWKWITLPVTLKRNPQSRACSRSRIGNCSGHFRNDLFYRHWHTS